VTFGPEDDSEFEAGGSLPDPGADDDLATELDLEQEPAQDQEYRTALPPKIESWRKRSATGAILTGFALGLQEALETKRQDPAIVVQTSGDPPRDLPIEADFEYGRPRQTVVNIRPWLLDDASGAGDSGPADPAHRSHPAEPAAGDGDAGPGEP